MTKEVKSLTLAKVLLIILATTLSVLVFGLCVPFMFIAFGILPNLGLGSIVYLIIGGSFGLLFGSISTGRSLFKSDKLFTKFFIRYLIILVLIIIIYFILFFTMAEAFSGI